MTYSRIALRDHHIIALLIIINVTISIDFNSSVNSDAIQWPETANTVEQLFARCGFQSVAV